jgi:hypothetical protein
MSLTRQQALAVRQILASSLISTDPTSASCEYHRLPAKNIQLIQSITLITDALPVTPYSRMVSVVMVEGLSPPSWYARPCPLPLLCPTRASSPQLINPSCA